MLTDAPRKSNRAGLLESDRIGTLDLPQGNSLPAIAKSTARNNTCAICVIDRADAIQIKTS
jgi:hypothetical protein